MKLIGILILITMSAMSLQARSQDMDRFIPLSVAYAWENANEAKDPPSVPAVTAWNETKDQRLNFGFRGGSLWVRIQGHPDAGSQGSFVLDLGNSEADEVELFRQSGTTLSRIATTGDERPFHERAYRHRNLLFPWVPLQPHENMLLRITSTGAHNYWIRLLPEAEIRKEAGIEDFLYGTSIGVIFIMACYNFFVFLLQRDPSHLFYTLYAASYIFLVLSAKGYGFQYIWPTAPGLQKYAIGGSVHITVLAFLLFTRTLLVREVDRSFRRLIDITMGVTLISLIMVVVSIDQRYWKQYGLAGASLFTFGVYLKAIDHARQHPDRSLWTILAAVFCLQLGGAINLLAIIGMLPYHWTTNNGMVIGGIIEMTLLTFTLADRFHRALQERARTDQALRGAVDDELAEQLKHNPQLLREEASERDLTVLFLDIVNSSRTSQMFPAREIYHKLRITLNDITTIIRAHEGVVNRSLGDGVLCYFGASWNGPVQTEHPTQALKAAIALQQHFLNECLDPEQRILFPMRIGIHSGRMYLGSIGDQQRVDFTLFGHEVHLAKRLENAANPFRILLSQASFDLLNRSAIAESIEPIHIPVKNQTELLQAYECNPFHKDLPRLQTVQSRLWLYFGSEIRDVRLPLQTAITMDMAGGRFCVLDVSCQGLCVEGPLYLARGVQVQLTPVGDAMLKKELEAHFLVPVHATVRWSEGADGVYRHGLEIQPLHAQQTLVWLQLFAPYVQIREPV